MDPLASRTPRSIQPDPVKTPRARSLPSARPFRLAVLLSSIHYLGLVGAVAAMVAVILFPSQDAVLVLVGAMLFSAFTWLLAFFKRRSTLCPLCKGTPLINSGARVHAKAERIRPLNHGVSATLAIMTTQKFRCMYCGTDYDLLKPRTHNRRGNGSTGR